MRRTSFYPGGPERGRQDVTPAEDAPALGEIESYPDAEALGFARNLELWGPAPFDLED